MRHTPSVLSIICVLSACFALGACDDGDDDKTGSGGSNADDNGEDESAGDDETMGAEVTGQGTVGEGGSGGITIPPECEALCDCIGGLGGDPLSCGAACGGAIVDAEPDDRTQCQAYVEMSGYADCSPECETFAAGG
jgi:hypothetical protein